MPLILGFLSCCDICAEDYSCDDAHLAPHAIECGHIFCKTCINGFSRKACPICRKTFSVGRRLHLDPAEPVVNMPPTQSAQSVNLLERVALAFDVLCGENPRLRYSRRFCVLGCCLVVSITMSASLALYLSSSSPQALPISIIESPKSSYCNKRFCRMIWNINWSCLVTTFVCTWVAVHPNIPGPEERWIKIASRRVGIMLMAIIAPEVVMTWALRQWFTARRLARKYKKYEWTTTHGFFAVMGGFMLFKDNKDPDPRTLYPDRLEEYLKRGVIDITEKEVWDRSRGDLLSTGLVMVQTGWFVVQCIIHHTEGLPLTELELMTGAFATLNFITYGLWWNKPLSVQCPYRVLEERRPMGEMGERRGDGNQEKNEVGQKVRGGSASIWRAFQVIITVIGITISHKGIQIARMVPMIPYALVTTIRSITVAVWKVVQAAVAYVQQNGVWGTIWKGIQRVFEVLVKPFLSMISDGDGIIEGKRVPTFYGGMSNDDEFKPTVIVASIIVALFGAIHCIGWNFAFASHMEQSLWRILSVAITCIPPALSIFYIMAIGYNNCLQVWLQTFSRRCESWWDRPMEFLVGVLVQLPASTLFILSCILYICARATLLILAFTSLRSHLLEACSLDQGCH